MAGIGAALDACLCSDDEMAEYRVACMEEEAKLAQRCGPFRFDVGSRVECLVREGEWARGTVVDKYYREPTWPPEEWTPYQVCKEMEYKDMQCKV